MPASHYWIKDVYDNSCISLFLASMIFFSVKKHNFFDLNVFLNVFMLSLVWCASLKFCVMACLCCQWCLTQKSGKEVIGTNELLPSPCTSVARFAGFYQNTLALEWCKTNRVRTNFLNKMLTSRYLLAEIKAKQHSAWS